MEITGSCHCGAVEYTAEVDPQRVGVCHCRDCQVLGGGAFNLSAAVAAADLSLRGATPKQYKKVSASGRARLMSFCGECSTMLFSGPAEADGPVGVSLRLMTSHQRAEFKPIAEIWCSSRVPWLAPIEGAPFKFEAQPDLS